MRTRFLALALLVAAPLVACAALSDDAGTQEADHTSGDPTYATYSWLWADESREAFESSMDKNGWFGSSAGNWLAADHPMTQRLQYWMDRFDDTLRREHPEELAGTPKPKVIILKSEQVNAWVSCIPTAWTVPVRIDGVQVDASADGDAPDAEAIDAGPVPSVEINFPRNALLSTRGYLSTPGTYDETKLGELTKFVNDGYSSCRARVENGGLVFGEGCPRERDVPARGEKLQYCPTGSHIIFTSQFLLQMLDEDRIVGVMAHELGHFYKTHASQPTDSLNYFYSLDTSHTHKPSPDPRTIEQTAKAREKLRNMHLRDGTASWASWEEENALMKERRLGFYTSEQEADELGLELLAKNGVPPSVLMNAMMTFLKLYPDTWSAGVTNWAECEALRENGFRDGEGKLFSPLVGDPSNAHHNTCFRVFNMQREIVAHQYTPGARPTMPGEPWNAVMMKFTNDMHAPPAPRPPPPPAPADAGTD